MRVENITSDQLITLLGVHRDDRTVLEIINKLGEEVNSFIDKEDGADNEYVEVRNRGFNLYFNAGRLVSVFLYSEMKDSSYCRYSLPLPHGVSFGQAKSEVLRRLGIPSLTGGGKNGFFGAIPVWVTYENGNYKLHLEFSDESGGLQMVTLMLTA